MVDKSYAFESIDIQNKLKTGRFQSHDVLQLRKNKRAAWAWGSSGLESFHRRNGQCPQGEQLAVLYKLLNNFYTHSTRGLTKNQSNYAYVLDNNNYVNDLDFTTADEYSAWWLSLTADVPNSVWSYYAVHQLPSLDVLIPNRITGLKHLSDFDPSKLKI